MNSFKKAAIESVDSMAELYKEIANEIWDNPELSLKEYKAAELYCKVLREHGFTVTEKSSAESTPPSEALSAAARSKGGV